jgi:hypothetical protein
MEKRRRRREGAVAWLCEGPPTLRRRVFCLFFDLGGVFLTAFDIPNRFFFFFAFDCFYDTVFVCLYERGRRRRGGWHSVERATVGQIWGGGQIWEKSGPGRLKAG